MAVVGWFKRRPIDTTAFRLDRTARHGATRHDKTGPAEVINRAARYSGAVFGRVTPTSAHRSEPGTNAENSRRSKINPVPRTISLPAKGKAPRVPYTYRHGRAAYRHVEEIAQQVRTQTPQGDQETVDEEPQGEKVGKLDLLALGHTGPRDSLFVVVPAVSGHQKHRHVHDVRGRELGGLRLDVLLLRRVRGESEEREYRERDDHLTLTNPPLFMGISVAAFAAITATDISLRSRGNPVEERVDPSYTCRARSANRRMVRGREGRNRNRKIAYRITAGLLL